MTYPSLAQAVGKLAGRVALVTGAGSGLGRAASLKLADEGAKIGLLSRAVREVDHVRKEIEERGGEALALPADVSNMEEISWAVDQIRDTWGRLDIVFANAGVNGTWAPLEEISESEWDETMSINLGGTFRTVKAALPLLKARGGSVIITSSVNGTRMFSNTGATAYACSKAAQVAFGKMIAVELGRSKVRVNVLCPGFIDTAIHENTTRRDLDKVQLPVEFPEGPIPLTGKVPGNADQVAQLVLFLASDDSSHITGSEVYIDGAQSLFQG